MATSKTVFMVLVVFVAMALIAGFAWLAGNNRNKHRASSLQARPVSTPADVGDHPSACTTTRHRSALGSSTTQWDRADTREVTKGASS
ncbi:hypothetical protein [Mycolicibacterium aubagnense]|uniref:hypothetical protein n=1 Tax=Mycolicibacterium aubagnense TaxID=319707 RepID=UPI0010FCF439|nr:hypothetical protein [Mycolicibacterium aubagnense]WGI33733.1 hypothetical protein QDT91_05020 [Mycolicibacterium aubagnense]